MTAQKHPASATSRRYIARPGVALAGLDQVLQGYEIERPAHAAMAQEVGRLEPAPVAEAKHGAIALTRKLEEQFGADPLLAREMSDATPAHQALRLQRHDRHVRAAVIAETDSCDGADPRLGVDVL